MLRAISKGIIFLKNRHFLSKKYLINWYIVSMRSQTVATTACKNSARLSFLNWIKMKWCFIRLWINVKRYFKESFHLKNERLTEITCCQVPHFIIVSKPLSIYWNKNQTWLPSETNQPFLDNKMSILRNVEPLREPPNSSRKKQKLSGIKNVDTQRGSVSGPCPASIDACTTFFGHVSDFADFKTSMNFHVIWKVNGIPSKYCP